MSFLDCVKDKIKEGILTEGEVNKLEKRYNELRSTYLNNMGSRDAAINAAQKVVEIEGEKIAQKKRNKLQHATRLKEVRDEIELMKAEDLEKEINKITKSDRFKNKIGLADALGKKEGKLYKRIENEARANLKKDYTAKYAGDMYNKVQVRQESVTNDLLKNMEVVADEYGADFLELNRKKDGIRSVIKEAMGEESGDQNATRLGKAIKETFKLARSRYVSSGGIMGEIKNYFPVKHAREAIEKVNPEEWVKYTMPRLDTSKMINKETGLPIKAENLEELLYDMYDMIIGRTDLDAESRIEAGVRMLSDGFDSASVQTKRDVSRYFKWKNADSMLEYNAKFGTGDEGLYDTMVGYVSSLAKDIAIIEVMSPNPKSMAESFSSMMKLERTPTLKRKMVDGAFKVVSGETNRWDGEPSNWYKGLEYTMAWIRSSTLGAATLSAISDMTFLVTTSRMNKLSATNSAKNYFKLINPASKSDREMAVRAGFVSDYVIGKVLSDTRYAGERFEGKIPQLFSNWTAKLSGLDKHTRAVADGTAIEAEALVGRLVDSKTKWDGLDLEFKEILESFGMNEKRWDLILKTDTTEISKGMKILRPMDIIDSKSGLDVRKSEVQFELEAETKARMAESQKRLKELEPREPAMNEAMDKLEEVFQIMEVNADKSPKEINELIRPELTNIKNKLKEFGINKRTPETILKEVSKVKADIEEARVDFNTAKKDLGESATKASELVEKEFFNEAKEATNAINDWIYHLRREVVNNPDAISRSISTGFGAKKGTGTRAMASILLMYKSFPITMMMSHLFPSIKRAMTGIKEAAGGDIRGIKKMDQLAMIAIGNTFLGGVALQLKDISKGREPRKIDDPRFLAASIAQGGGLGLFGDFIFSDESRFGRGMIQELTGPVGGLASDLMKTVKGNMQKDIDGYLSGEKKDINYALSGFKVAKRNVPVVKLWYTRLVIERLLMDNIERMLDPKFDRKARKRENKFYRKTKQKNYWRKGKMLPFE